MAERSARTPTLLLVDDEAQILSALRRSLRREGYRILCAESPREALRLLAERPVDLVLSDQRMPGMSGLQLLEEVARLRPGTARMIITGGTEELPRAQLRRIGVCALLTKPWQDERLKATLRRALGAPPVARERAAPQPAKST